MAPRPTYGAHTIENGGMREVHLMLLPQQTQPKDEEIEQLKEEIEKLCQLITLSSMASSIVSLDIIFGFYTFLSLGLHSNDPTKPHLTNRDK